MVDLARHTTFEKQTLSLSKTQFGLVCFAFGANLVFIPSVSTYVKKGTWGGASASMQLPDSAETFLGFNVPSYTLITLHAAAALALAAALFTQFLLTHRTVRTQKRVNAHRFLGPIILCTLLPVFLVFAFSMSLWVIRTPFNRVMFTVLPVMIIYAIVRALIGLRRGDRDLHADSMFLAFMLLESAPIYRIVMFVVARLGGQGLAPNGEPIDAGALFRTVIVLVLLTVGYWTCRRLRRNAFPLALIASVLVLSMVFLPWSLTGAPS